MNHSSIIRRAELTILYTRLWIKPAISLLQSASLLSKCPKKKRKKLLLIRTRIQAHIMSVTEILMRLPTVSSQVSSEATMLRQQEQSSTGSTTICGSDFSPEHRTMKMPHTEDLQDTAVTVSFTIHAARCFLMLQASLT